jgi:MAPEG family
MQAQILAPAAALVLWSLVMVIWMAATRLPAMSKLGNDLKTAPPGGRGQNLEGVLPDKVQWKSHNYAHLMEQPTIFYPTVVILALMGGQWRRRGLCLGLCRAADCALDLAGDGQHDPGPLYVVPAIDDLPGPAGGPRF